MIRNHCLSRSNLNILRLCTPHHPSRSQLLRAFTSSPVQHAHKPRLRTRPSTGTAKATAPPPTTSKSSHPIIDAISPPVTTLLPYPDAIRIFSRSSSRIALLGIIRLSPLVLLTLWSLNITSLILDSPVAPDYAHILQNVTTLLPIFLVLPWTSGYVTRVLVQLPLDARRSRDALRKWVESAKVEEALVEIKTVRVNGFSWATTQCKISELRARKPTLFNQANFERIVDPATDRRRMGSAWQRVYAWASEPPRFLKITEAEGVKSAYVKEPWVWGVIARRIEARSGITKASTKAAKTG